MTEVTALAKRFRFRLETLLRVRELREREAKRSVAGKQAEIAQLDQFDEQAAAEIVRHHQTLRARQETAQLDPQALARERAWIAHLRRMIAQRRVLRAEKLEELAGLQRGLREARTRTRILEKLRSRRYEDHRRKTKRLEQRESDELARRLLVNHSSVGERLR